jgi:hypothetical protein
MRMTPILVAALCCTPVACKPQPGQVDQPQPGRVEDAPRRAEEPLEPAAREDISGVPADMSFTAQQFFSKYKSNTDQAFQELGGKVIEITGVVGLYGRNIYDDVFINLEIPGNILGGNLGSEHSEPWAFVARGQTARLKGRWPQERTRRGPRFVVVETDTNTRLRVDPEELAQEFVKEPDAAANKYNFKHLILTGTIDGLDFEDPNVGTKQVNVLIKSNSKLKPNCHFVSDERERLRGFAAGQRIQFVCDSPAIYKGRLVLLQCYLVTTEPPAVPTNAALNAPAKDQQKP